MHSFLKYAEWTALLEDEKKEKRLYLPCHLICDGRKGVQVVSMTPCLAILFLLRHGQSFSAFLMVCCKNVRQVQLGGE